MQSFEPGAEAALWVQALQAKLAEVCLCVRECVCERERERGRERESALWVQALQAKLAEVCVRESESE